MARILVIEDEKKMAAFIQQGLIDQGHDVLTREHPAEALKLCQEKPCDLYIVDVMLPDMNGLQLSKELRAKQPKALILMLTALSTTQDKVQGLDAGADDYLTKPFELTELSARVRALLRRHTEAQTVLSNGDLSMDLIKRTVVREGRSIELTSKEFALLELFMRQIDKVLDRNTIAQQVWGSEFDPESNVIDVYVNHLRKKMDQGHARKLLKTVVGHGYTLAKNN